jgi:transcriptional regulator of arginine metabolism
VNTYTVHDKQRRHQMIRAALRSGSVGNQEQLAEMLASSGLVTTQATLSRDLRELGVMKGPEGYVLPGTAGPAHHNGDLERALRTLLLRGETGGSIAVLHTGPGRAPLLALEIDRAGLKPVLGTVAGDDTIFVATRSTRDAGRILTQFKQLAGMA